MISRSPGVRLGLSRSERTFDACGGHFEWRVVLAQAGERWGLQQQALVLFRPGPGGAIKQIDRPFQNSFA